MHWKEGGNDNDTHKDKYKDKDKDRDIDKNNWLKRSIICYIFKRVGSSRISMVTSWVSDKNRDSTSRDMCVLHKGWSVFRSTQNFFLTRKIDEYQWQYRNLLMGTLSRGWILKARSRKVLQFNRNTVQLCYISSAWYFDLFFIVGFQVATI